MKIPRLPVDTRSPQICNECWFYDPEEIGFGPCFGWPPQVVVNDEGTPTFVRVHVNAEDKGCSIFKPRYGVN